MKILALLFLVFVSSAFAKDLCVSAPDQSIGYDSMGANGDGSITFTLPTFLLNGKLTKVDCFSEAGFCHYVGKTASPVVLGSETTSEPAVSLADNGMILGVSLRPCYITAVICR